VALTVEPAPAKINLALHVRRRRADGYHDIETLFAFLADGDVLTAADAERDSFAITGPFAGSLARGETNLVTAARDAFVAAFGVATPLAVVLDKRLPVASGIGGGSADAAAMLRVLARRHGVGLDDPSLAACAARLGADVPACLVGRTAFGTGTGVDLRPVGGLTGLAILLINPNVAVSTAQVFAAWDGIDRGPLGVGDPLAVARAGRNDLEPAARRFASEIDDVLGVLTASAGMTLARMSGSGATCFAVFDSAASRSAAAIAIRAARPDWWLLESTLV
jgi:4-diphosphocytidyl-2-C-methyl-D-erythritol kinase